jgi:hypothetical protein
MDAHKEHPIRLNEYEIANLQVGLLLLRHLGADTGDWLGQVLHKLPPVTQVPNQSLDTQMNRHENGWIKLHALREYTLMLERHLAVVNAWLSDPNSLTVEAVGEMQRQIRTILKVGIE